MIRSAAVRSASGRRLAAVGLLLAAIAAAYLPALLGDFTNFDDDEFVTRNPNLRAGLTWAGARWAFATFHAANWIPLAWLSHALDVSLFGFAPWGHHLSSVLLHGANAVLVFLLLRSMTGAAGRSLAVAALFALHPLNVETVAWVAQRKNVLSTFFWLLALGAHHRYARRPTAGRYLATASLVACGLLAKPMAVTLPLTLLLLDVWPLGRVRPSGGDRTAGRGARVFGRLLLEKVPLFALAAAAGVLTLAAQRSGGTVAAFEDYPLTLRLLNIPIAYAGYLGKMLWPSGLGPGYMLHGAGIGAGRAGLTLASLVLVTVGALRLRSRQPWLAVGWVWFLSTLLPVIGLVQVGTQALADRYAYVPLLGPFVMLAWGFPAALRPGRRREVLLGAAAALAVLTLAGLTRIQAGFWRDGVTLMTRAVGVAASEAGGRLPPDAWNLADKLGSAYSERGQYERALAAYHLALAANPGVAEVRYNIGNAYSALGRLGEAAASFREATRLRPDYADAWYNLGNTLLLMGRGDESRQAFERAAQIEARRAAVP